jgi:hypothetical protein
MQPGSLQSPYKSGDFQMPVTLSKIKYGTRSIVHCEALEQTLRLRLVSGPADNFFFLIMGSAPTPTVCEYYGGIDLLRRSLVGFRTICVLDEPGHYSCTKFTAVVYMYFDSTW